VIVCRSEREIATMRTAGQLLARILVDLRSMVVPGVTTLDLDAEAERRIREADAVPAFKNYRGFPFTLCTSVNDHVIHGFPSRAPLEAGDILSIDVGLRYEGYFADSATTVPVGPVPQEVETLLRVTEASLYLGIEQARPGMRVGDIGHAVQSHVEAHGFSVVREFVGHGVGVALHEELQVPNYGKPGRGTRLTPGMVFAIEPMVNMGRAAVKVLADGWTAATRDGSLSAHYEHTVAVTDAGPLILTAVDEATARQYLSRPALPA
jgi:methionyl aminopeptidase